MVERWLIGIVVSFVLRQIAKFGREFDWDKLAADVSVRVRAVVPGDWLDDEAVAAVGWLIDSFREALAAKEDLEAIMTSLANSEWAQAADALRTLVLKVWADPSTELAAESGAEERFATAFGNLNFTQAA